MSTAPDIEWPEKPQ
ncbi:TPA: hypothetical protein ACYRPQ_001321 [Proteus mirabilis]